MKVKVGTDEAKEDRDTSMCVIDPTQMVYNPVKVVFVHLDFSTSRRKLLWNDEILTDVEQRRCVVWNEDIGTNGAWDGTHCTTVLTEQTQTTCECSVFGTMAVISGLIFLNTIVIHNLA